MTIFRNIIFMILVVSFFPESGWGQMTISSTGGNASGSGGSVSFTAGQVTYNTYSGTTGSVAQGVQQPYEISVVTAVENTESITLGYKVYPNPTSGVLILTAKLSDTGNSRFRLYDLNGILLQDMLIESDLTEIDVQFLSPGIYFLSVIQDNQEVKVFKIIKK
jgi:hypothetical protein